MHLAAHLLIKNGISRESNPNFYQYVEDAIEKSMETEKKLTMSNNIFGTADAIVFNPQTMEVYIFDLKTGDSGKMLQLKEYLAIFVYQYGQLYRFGPYDIKAELRIYKPDTIEIEHPTGEEIAELLRLMVEKDNWGNEIDAGGTLLCNMLII